VVVLSGVVQRQDVRMLQPGDRADLPQESLRAHRGRELRLQDLDRDEALVLVVLREVHGRHATPTDLTLDRESLAEQSRKSPAIVGVVHVRPDLLAIRKVRQEIAQTVPPDKGCDGWSHAVKVCHSATMIESFSAQSTNDGPF